jgi:hypothetical protein
MSGCPAQPPRVSSLTGYCGGVLPARLCDARRLLLLALEFSALFEFAIARHLVEGCPAFP